MSLAEGLLNKEFPIDRFSKTAQDLRTRAYQMLGKPCNFKKKKKKKNLSKDLQVLATLSSLKSTSCRIG